MCYRAKFHQNRPNGFGDRDFSFFKMAGSAILDFEILKLLVAVSLGGRICIAVPNFIKIDQTVAKILHLTFFKMAVVRHLEFLKIQFF